MSSPRRERTRNFAGSWVGGANLTIPKSSPLHAPAAQFTRDLMIHAQLAAAPRSPRAPRPPASWDPPLSALMSSVSPTSDATEPLPENHREVEVLRTLTHKSGEALEENRLLRHEVKELRRLVDLLNDRNPVANLALDQVNQAFQVLGLPTEPPGRGAEPSDAWTDVDPLESARASAQRDGAHGKAAASEYGQGNRPKPINHPPSSPPGRTPTEALEALRSVIVPSKLAPSTERLVAKAVQATTADATRPERPTDDFLLRPVARVPDVTKMTSGDLDESAPLLLAAPTGHVPQQPLPVLARHCTPRRPPVRIHSTPCLVLPARRAHPAPFESCAMPNASQPRPSSPRLSSTRRRGD